MKKHLIYALAIAGMFLTVSASYALTSSDYNGKTLYNSNCSSTSCHGAYPGNKQNSTASKIQDAITNNTGGMGSLSFLTSDQIQVIANAIYVKTMSVPSAQSVYSINPAGTAPVRNNASSVDKPIGTGNIAGGFLNWHIDLPNFSGPVDIIAAISADFISDIYLLDSNNNLVSLASSGLVYWKRSSTGNISESLFGDIPTSSLPHGTYTLYLVVTPAGSISNYYFWTTLFTL